MGPLERAPETVPACISRGCAGTSAQCILWHSNFCTVQTNRSAFFYRELLYNVGESSVVNLLPSQMAMVIEAFGASSHLEKHLKFPFGLFYDFWGIFFTSCLQSGGCPLGSTSTIRVYIQKKTIPFPTLYLKSN